MSILYRNDKLDKISNQKIGENIFHAGNTTIDVTENVYDSQTGITSKQSVTLNLKDVYDETSEGIFYEPSTSLRGMHEIDKIMIYDPVDFAGVAPSFSQNTSDNFQFKFYSSQAGYASEVMNMGMTYALPDNATPVQYDGVTPTYNYQFYQTGTWGYLFENPNYTSDKIFVGLNEACNNIPSDIDTKLFGGKTFAELVSDNKVIINKDAANNNSYMVVAYTIASYYVDVVVSPAIDKKEFVYNSSNNKWENEGQALDLTTNKYLVTRVNATTYRFYNLEKEIPLDFLKGSSQKSVPIPSAGDITTIATESSDINTIMTNDISSSSGVTITYVKRPNINITLDQSSEYIASNVGLHLVGDGIAICGNTVIDIANLKFKNKQYPQAKIGVSFENNTLNYVEDSSSTPLSYFDYFTDRYLVTDNGYIDLYGNAFDFDHEYIRTFNDAISYSRREELVHRLSSYNILNTEAYQVDHGSCANGLPVKLDWNYTWNNTTKAYEAEYKDINNVTVGKISMKEGLFYFNFMPYVYDFNADSFYVDDTSFYVDNVASLYPQVNENATDSDAYNTLVNATRTLTGLTQLEDGYENLDLTKDFAFIDPKRSNTVFRFNLTTGKGIKMTPYTYNLGIYDIASFTDIEGNSISIGSLDLGSIIAEAIQQGYNWQFDSYNCDYYLSYMKHYANVQVLNDFKDNIDIEYLFYFEPRYYGLSAFACIDLDKYYDSTQTGTASQLYLGTLFLDKNLHYYSVSDSFKMGLMWNNNAYKFLSEVSNYRLLKEYGNLRDRSFASYITGYKMPLNTTDIFDYHVGNTKLPIDNSINYNSVFAANGIDVPNVCTAYESYNGSTSILNRIMAFSDYLGNALSIPNILNIHRLLTASGYNDISLYYIDANDSIIPYNFPQNYAFPVSVSLDNVLTIDNVNNVVSIAVNNLIGEHDSVYNGLLDTLVKEIITNYNSLGLLSLSKIVLTGIATLPELHNEYGILNNVTNANATLIIELDENLDISTFTNGLQLLANSNINNIRVNSNNAGIHSVNDKVIITDGVAPGKILKLLVDHTVNHTMLDLSSETSVDLTNIADFAYGNTLSAKNYQSGVGFSGLDSIIVKFDSATVFEYYNGEEKYCAYKVKSVDNSVNNKSSFTNNLSLSNLHLENVERLNVDFLDNANSVIVYDDVALENKMSGAKTYLKAKPSHLITLVSDFKDYSNFVPSICADIVFDNVYTINAVCGDTLNNYKLALDNNPVDIYIPDSVTKLGGDVPSDLTNNGYISYCPFAYGNNPDPDNVAVIHFGGTESQWNEITYDTDWEWMKDYPYIVFNDPGDDSLIDEGDEKTHTVPSPRQKKILTMVIGDTLYVKSGYEVEPEYDEYSGRGPLITNATTLSNIRTVEFENVIKPTSTGDWFAEFDHLTQITNISNLDTTNVTNMAYMFSTCAELTSLDLSNFNTSNVTSMSGMFNNCRALTSLNISNFNTANVEDMSYMFHLCDALTSLNVSNFDTSNVTAMNSMFRECSALTSLDLSNFDTSNVTDMDSMFYFSDALVTIKVNSNRFNVDNVNNSGYMFDKCTSIRGGNGTTYNSSKIDKEYARVDTASTPGYFTAA